VVAVGDGANDILMLKEAGLGIAYNAKPFVRNQIELQLNTNDMTRILDIVGFPRTIG